MGGLRLTYTTALVLQALAAGHRYGFQVMDATGLASGTVYPVLRRLHRSSWVRARWEDVHEADAEGRPRRRYYQLAAPGRAALQEARGRFQGIERAVAAPSRRAGEAGA